MPVFKHTPKINESAFCRSVDFHACWGSTPIPDEHKMCSETQNSSAATHRSGAYVTMDNCSSFITESIISLSGFVKMPPLRSLGTISGTLHDCGPEALFAVVNAATAKTIIFSSAISVDEERPLTFHPFGHARHYGFLS